MGRKQRSKPVQVAGPVHVVRKDGGNEFRRLLLGQPSMTGVVWLLAIALVIGVSGGYIVYRVMGTSTAPEGVSAQDPAAPWRARLLQNPKDVEALLALAHVQLDQQQLDAAESLYQQVLAIEPKNTEAITHIGNVLLGRGQPDAALARYNEALAINPHYVHALWDKANLLQRVKKDYPAAIRVWEAFIQEVGAESQDGKTAQNFIADAKRSMDAQPAAESKAGGKS
jgi:cytochrome c-type biogenesis protein CcmH/NrfG